VNGVKRYSVVCPGSARFGEEQRKRMSKDDPHLHGGAGWYSDMFPDKCPKCGDEVQYRGEFMVYDLKEEA
jgi:hypothetical protein